LVSKIEEQFMSVSLIISIYKLQAELPLLISALAQQSQNPDEIIFAEDDESLETIEILKKESEKYPHLSMKLVQHEDRGFRKAEIVNKAVAIAAYEKLIFLDGDCLPHYGYVKAYAKNLVKGKVLSSRLVRFLVDQRRFFESSEGTFKPLPWYQILRNAHPPQRRYCIHIPFYPVLQRNSSLRGSSWACMKDDFLNVNGYDEKFCIAGYGYEDTDISHRLNRAGVDSYVAKFSVIYYHFLDRSHATSKTFAMRHNQKLLLENDRSKVTRCELGINQWLDKVGFSWESN
jgi:GT2 family glycosyltransferase